MLSKLRTPDLDSINAELSRMLNEAAESMEVRDYALSIVPSFGEDQIKAVYQNVKATVRYQPDPTDKELFISPKKMVEKIHEGGGAAAGDCDDIALFTAGLYRALGYASRIVLLATKGDEFDHAAAEVYSDKLREWVFVDPTSPEPLGWIPVCNRRLEVG